MTSRPDVENNRFGANQVYDPEKVGGRVDDVSEPQSRASRRLYDVLTRALYASPVEIRGVMPVPLEDRTSTRYSSYFSIWACMNINLLP